MVKDKRACIGCGKPVPNGMRERLSREGWSFIQIKEDGKVEYYSNCGCLDHDRFAEMVEKERKEAAG